MNVMPRDDDYCVHSLESLSVDTQYRTPAFPLGLTLCQRQHNLIVLVDAKFAA